MNAGERLILLEVLTVHRKLGEGYGPNAKDPL
jgi:hypothetical protein